MIKKWFSNIASIIILFLSLPGLAAQHQSTSNWSGGYLGFHSGVALGKFEVSNPFGASIYGDTIRTPGFIGGVQAGYNWQLPGSIYVYGIEAELSGLDAEGTNTCFAYTGRYVSANCSANPDVSGKLSARLGIALGTAGRTLFYIKGGVAFLDNDLEATNNNEFWNNSLVSQKHSDSTVWGGTAGVGIEFAMVPNCSVKLEYDYLGLAGADINAPPSALVSPDFETAALTAGAKASVSQHMHQIMLGLNYHLSPNGIGNSGYSSSFLGTEGSSAMVASGWQLETGLRYFYSSGRFQKDMPVPDGVSSSIVSRLVYDDLGAHAGELFARLDTSSHLFVKALAGVGRITSGHMNDEDWGFPTDFIGNPTPIAYSNTFSDLDKTNLHYATIDLGYDLLYGSDYKVGLFVGYNRIKEQYIANDITQIASTEIHMSAPAGRSVITETDKWNALRIGFASQVWLTPQWRLNFDAAYLPYIHFNGEDDHWLRGLVINEMSSGRGVQFEAVASYSITPQAQIGLGGRYWAAWSADGSDKPNGSKPNRVDTYRYQRYGAFIQGSYSF